MIEPQSSRLPSQEELTKLWPFLKPRERERLAMLLGPRIDHRWCPHKPYPKQQTFLASDDREVLYGGAAGGGKSDALLMAFLQHVDQPHYRGLILRRKSVDLERSEAILERAKSWWLPASRTGVVYYAQKKKFVFPSGATCEFGHANNIGDEEENYQGGAWHFIAFDELTQFAARQYLYLFSRNRRTTGEDGLPALPLRIRATSNPGGESHHFVRDRFMSQEYAKAFLENRAAPFFRQVIPTEDGDWTRSFVPSKAQDNLGLDLNAYRAGLRQMDVVSRERLMSGDWLVSEAGVYRPEWFRRFRYPEDGGSATYKLLKADGSVGDGVFPHDCHRFMTVDPAGTSVEKKKQVEKGADPCWSTCSVWDFTPQGYLLWRRIARVQGEFPDVMQMIRDVHREERTVAIWIEIDGVGRPYFQQLEREGFPVYALQSGGKDKLTRAAPSTNEAKEGRIFLPYYAPWKDALEAELFAWQGTSDEVCDQIDTLAYAVLLKISGSLGGSIVLQ